MFVCLFFILLGLFWSLWILHTNCSYIYFLKNSFVPQLVVMPTVSEYDVFKSASPAVQENMTYYFNQSASLRSWSAVSVEGSASLSPVFGEIFGEGQSINFTYLTYLYTFKKQYPASRGVFLAWHHLQSHLRGLSIT